MAVRNKPKKQPKGSNLHASIVAQIDDLLRTHTPDILEFLDGTEDKKETVTFGCVIDCSESEPQVKVAIRYSQSVTDSRVVRLDDVDQGTFTPVVKEAEEETVKRRKRNVARVSGDGEPADPEAQPETA